MSQHPSLKSVKVGKKIRTVLKRYEKFFALKEKGIIKEDDPIFGMPKFKIVRTKIKKEKAAEKPAEGEAVAAGTAVVAPKKEEVSKTQKDKK